MKIKNISGSIAGVILLVAVGLPQTALADKVVEMAATSVAIVTASTSAQRLLSP